NLCGIPDMVENGKSGLLLTDPTDPQELAATIERLLADDSLRRAQGQSAQARALELFHPNNVAEKTKAVYNLAITNYSPNGTTI
ncbi:MAG: glycosyltransferase involved in cell wall biosynthesis, partial [Candidatus Azotimanducaceae bacterium]